MDKGSCLFEHSPVVLMMATPSSPRDNRTGVAMETHEQEMELLSNSIAAYAHIRGE